jgi:hypothetical protein
MIQKLKLLFKQKNWIIQENIKLRKIADSYGHALAIIGNWENQMSVFDMQRKAQDVLKDYPYLP